MEFKYIKDTIKLLEKFLDKYGGYPVPCSKREVEKLESMLPDSYRLPAAYKEFLLYGGKAMGQFYEPGNRFDYERALDYVISGRNSAILLLEQYEDNPQLPDDVYVITTYMSSFFNFFKLTEGENPPVYQWLEEDEIGTEAIEKKHNSFTDFIREEIRIRHLLLRPSVKRDEISLGKLPRGQQYWIAELNEETEGIVVKNLANYFGVAPLWKLEKITETLNITPTEYLEELSGWKALKIEDEIRFFPPSYESPEEKEKKILEQQKQLESKKQELLLVEKRITNYQSRIKNLSGGKLTGSSIDNSSAMLLKELKRDLQKQNLLKQKLERQITELENKIN